MIEKERCFIEDKKCTKDCTCIDQLVDSHFNKVYCEVIPFSDNLQLATANQLFLCYNKREMQLACPHSVPSPEGYFCHCPIRKEIFQKYGI